MKRSTIPALLITSALTFASLVAVSSPAEAAIPPKWRNCTVVNNRLPHGVGRRHAHDQTSGTPVTNFRRSNALYAEAMRANRGLDRDHDKIACEKL